MTEHQLKPSDYHGKPTFPSFLRVMGPHIFGNLGPKTLHFSWFWGPMATASFEALQLHFAGFVMNVPRVNIRKTGGFLSFLALDDHV